MSHATTVTAVSRTIGYGSNPTPALLQEGWTSTFK
jgi:hypothetical protein